ncbi:uncharacterized protein BO80DRAFT_346023, partial [Aspergillus ibericus CBS 121593]
KAYITSCYKGNIRKYLILRFYLSTTNLYDNTKDILEYLKIIFINFYKIYNACY